MTASFKSTLSAGLVCMALAGCSGQAITEWAPAGDHIRTSWAEELNPSNVHTEYPRPKMVREDWQTLNGLWDYAIAEADAASMPEADGKILVPFPVESSLSGVGRMVSADSSLWYKRVIEIPKQWKGKRVRLNFDAVDWDSELFVNGQSMGRHTGGYTAFSYDITDFLSLNGKQTIELKVLDATDEGNFQPRGKQVSNPKGIWYTRVTGIWQTVWMEAVPETSVSSYYSEASVTDSTLTVYPEIRNAKEGDTVKIELIEGKTGYSAETPGHKIIASLETQAGKPAVFKLDGFSTWSPDDPYLYGLNVSIVRAGKTVDKVYGYTAMREVGTATDEKGHKFFTLNGKKIFHYGPLDQGWWPDGLYTAPTDEALRYDVEMTRAYGFNMIRKHIKIEPARWYTHCDQLGMMVWQDMPSTAANDLNHWGRKEYDEGTDFPLSEAAKANYYKEWAEIISQIKTYPCITVWVPFNEAWGQFDTEAAVDFTKKQDNTRLVNMSSGGNWVSGGVGDILDMHNYPEPRMAFWDYDLINVVGEYGGLGLPLEGHLWQEDKNWGYQEFKTFEEVTDKYVEFAGIVKELIGQGLGGAVYTQTTDVEGEVNGLMTYDRKVNKLDVARVAAANREAIEALK